VATLGIVNPRRLRSTCFNIKILASCTIAYCCCWRLLASRAIAMVNMMAFLFLVPGFAPRIISRYAALYELFSK
jgi:hypothetical protein